MDLDTNICVMATSIVDKGSIAMLEHNLEAYHLLLIKKSTIEILKSSWSVWASRSQFQGILKNLFERNKSYTDWTL